MDLVRSVEKDGARTKSISRRAVYVNVIMRKRNWLVRVSQPDQSLVVFCIPPSVKILTERLEQDYPGQKCRIDYLGFFQIF